MLLRDDTSLVAIIGNPVRPMPTVYAYNKCFASIGAQLACLAFEPSGAREAVEAMRALRFRGMAVTMPYKAEALSASDVSSSVASMVGACNTLYWRDDQIVAENTDVLAVEALLRRLPAPGPRRAVVIGSGGASRAAVAALGQAGYSVAVLARNPATGQRLAQEFAAVTVCTSQAEVALDEPFGLIINATPVGWTTDESPIDSGFLLPGTTVVDFVFTAATTRLLLDAAAAGCSSISGLSILAMQAVRQIELWTGHVVDEHDLHRWLAEALDV